MTALTSQSTLPTAHRADPVGRAKELRSLIEADAARATAQGAVTEEVMAAIVADGLHWMQVPTCLGGKEVDVRTAYEVIEALSYADGSTGWSFMANAGTLALLGMYLDDDGAAEVFADRSTLAAGMFGVPRGTAVSEDGGYRASGRFSFGSGSAHAHWILGAFRELDAAGAHLRHDNGLPRMIVGAVPVERVEFLGNWDVLGLQATASGDYQIPEQHVDTRFTWEFFTAELRRGGPMYRMGPNFVPCIDHASFSTGAARRALDEMAAIAIDKRRPGRPRLVDDKVFLYDYARAEGAMMAGRAYVLEALHELEQAALADRVTPRLKAAARLATTFAAESAIAAGQFCYRYAGSSGLRNGTVLQQCFRDLQASAAHVFTDHNSWVDAESVLMGVESPTLHL